MVTATMGNVVYESISYHGNKILFVLFNIDWIMKIISVTNERWTKYMEI